MTYVTKTWQDTGNEQPPDTRIAAAILVVSSKYELEIVLSMYQNE